jgi:chemotaxis protein MotB
MNKQIFLLLLAFLAAASFQSCVVGKKKFDRSQSELQRLRQDSTALAARVTALESNVGDLELSKTSLEQNISHVKEQLETTSRDAAGKIASQQSLLHTQQQKLEALQSLLEQQKKNADVLRQKIADALTKFNSSELSVTMKNGKVYVSLQENLLFPSGSAVVNPKGKEALGKLAEVLNTNPDINVTIEGHTDSLPIRMRFEDNWALSTARATSIVRILTKDYKVDPVRVVASGHSSYDPVDSNSTPEGRARNRRTEIILTPKLDELYNLING